MVILFTAVRKTLIGDTVCEKNKFVYKKFTIRG